VALTPNFDRIVATITASDIEKFLRSAAPEDDKQRVLNAATQEIRMRLVGGYLIRTNQVSAERLTGKKVKSAEIDKTAASRAVRSPKRSASPQ
jgi:hypothetical protein